MPGDIEVGVDYAMEGDAVQGQHQRLGVSSARVSESSGLWRFIAAAKRATRAW